MGEQFQRRYWNPHWIRVAEEDEAMKLGPWVARKRKAFWEARFAVAVANCNEKKKDVSFSGATAGAAARWTCGKSFRFRAYPAFMWVRGLSARPLAHRVPASPLSRVRTRRHALATAGRRPENCICLAPSEIYVYIWV